MPWTGCVGWVLGAAGWLCSMRVMILELGGPRRGSCAGQRPVSGMRLHPLRSRVHRFESCQGHIETRSRSTHCVERPFEFLVVKPFCRTPAPRQGLSRSGRQDVRRVGSAVEGVAVGSALIGRRRVSTRCCRASVTAGSHRPWTSVSTRAGWRSCSGTGPPNAGWGVHRPHSTEEICSSLYPSRSPSSFWVSPPLAQKLHLSADGPEEIRRAVPLLRWLGPSLPAHPSSPFAPTPTTAFTASPTRVRGRLRPTVPARTHTPRTDCAPGHRTSVKERSTT